MDHTIIKDKDGYKFFSRTITKGIEQLNSLAEFDNGEAVRKRVDELVASVFLPKPTPDKTELVHLDGNASNNNANNLAWMTKEEADDHKNTLTI